MARRLVLFLIAGGALSVLVLAGSTSWDSLAYSPDYQPVGFSVVQGVGVIPMSRPGVSHRSTEIWGRPKRLAIFPGPDHLDRVHVTFVSQYSASGSLSSQTMYASLDEPDAFGFRRGWDGLEAQLLYGPVIATQPRFDVESVSLALRANPSREVSEEVRREANRPRHRCNVVPKRWCKRCQDAKARNRLTGE